MSSNIRRSGTSRIAAFAILLARVLLSIADSNRRQVTGQFLLQRSVEIEQKP